MKKAKKVVAAKAATKSAKSSGKVETVTLKHLAAALAEAHEILRILDARIAERGNIIHGAWTLVDADFSSVLGWAFHMTKLDTSNYRHLNAWLARAHERPASRRLFAQAQS